CAGSARSSGTHDTHGIGWVQLAPLRGDLEIDHAVTKHGRCKCKAHTEFLELHAGRIEGTLHGKRKLAAGKKTRGIARQGHQVWFSKKACHSTLLECLDDHVHASALIEQPRNTKAKRHVVGHQSK